MRPTRCFAQSKGWKKIYILNDGETYGAGIATNFVNAAKSLGITILGNDKWDKAAPNYQALSTRRSRARAPTPCSSAASSRTTAAS